MYNNSKSNIILPTLVAVALVVGLLVGSLINKPNMLNVKGGANSTLSGNKLSYTMSLIQNMYVDSVNIDSIAEQVMPDLLKSLDPHSVYIPLSEMRGANETLDGKFDGIGVMFNMSTDTVIVLNVIAKGPSEKAGVKAGDRIIKINDTIVAGQKIDQNQIVKKLRGPRGTEVRIEVQRSGLKALLPIKIERGEIPIKSIDAAFMLEPKVGFLKLTAFSRNSHAEILQALLQLQKEGMNKLVFDLRGNSGGFLDQAILIANEFLPADKLIVYTEDRLKRRKEEYSDGKGRFAKMELVVLIDEGSASSSEILAGAIQDNDRGTIIGRRSYGKGLVQQQFPFQDGSALRLTIARYFTPTGRSIQKPYTKGKEEYSNDLSDRYKHNEFFSADSIKFADSLRFTTPGGKTVYGGGGIMPDIFIPMDTSRFTPYFSKVSGLLYKYTMEYTDAHREQLNKIKTAGELSKFFSNDDTLLNGFVRYAARNGVPANSAQITISRPIILAQMKAYISRNTPLEDIGFYLCIYPIDEVMIRAIKELGGK